MKHANHIRKENRLIDIPFSIRSIEKKEKK